MQLGSWEIGRALGIPIRVHASWFLVFFLVTSSLASGYLPANLPGLSEERYWAMGAVAAVLLFGSVVKVQAPVLIDKRLIVDEASHGCAKENQRDKMQQKKPSPQLDGSLVIQTKQVGLFLPFQTNFG